jgi:hypothetical protein
MSDEQVGQFDGVLRIEPEPCDGLPEIQHHLAAVVGDPELKLSLVIGCDGSFWKPSSSTKLVFEGRVKFLHDALEILMSLRRVVAMVLCRHLLFLSSFSMQRRVFERLLGQLAAAMRA